MSTIRRHLLALSLAVLALSLAAVTQSPLAPRPATAAATILDLGRLTLSQDGQPARVEDFAYERVGDSLLVRAASAPWRQREEDLRFDKKLLLVAEAHDYELISFSSEFTGARDTLHRGITLARGDTAFTLWREHNGRGTGDVWARPAGRVYVLDAPLFTLFGYIGWTLQGRSFDRRPVNIVVLGARDTLVVGTVTDAGAEKLTWNDQSVDTRKLLIGDERTTVEAWFTLDGHLLRLEEPRAHIRAERDAPTAPDAPARPAQPAPGR